MYYKSHKVSFVRGGSNIDSPDEIKEKKATMNPKNTDDKCFQYAATVALNYGEIESHPERVSSIKPFIGKYNWEEINYSSKNRWLEKTIEKSNPTITPNISYNKQKEIYPSYIHQ